MDIDKHSFELKDQEYIQLNTLLKLLSLVNSGGEAKMMIKEGLVTVNGEVEYRLRHKLRKDSVVLYDGHEITIK